MGSDARQQVVREVNERIRELSLNGAEVLKAGQTRFLCECSDPACLETMALSFVEYERVRNQHGQILVSARHEVEAPSADNLDAVLEEIRTEAADIRSELRLRLAETRQTSERNWPRARTLAAGTQLAGRANQAKAADLAAEDETMATP